MKTATDDANGTTLTLTAADGYLLAATRFEAREPLRGHLIVAGATGVPQGFYRRFAEHASRRGFTTLTFDYRGIGKSKPTRLKGFEANYLDWAKLDLAAAVEAMTADGVPLFMVGHSFGGHAFGLLPDPDRVVRFYTFGSGSGWHGWMPRLEGLRVLFLWNCVLPVLTHFKGYMPMSWLGAGEDLPLGVYRQWRRWCRFPRYFFDDPAVADRMQQKFDRARTPIVAANALDDAWISPRARDAFMPGYRNAPVERVDLDPAPFGGIGHMGYFRPKAEALWNAALSWFEMANADIGKPMSK
jgi:predicted alpha/beta hydrolase